MLATRLRRMRSHRGRRRRSGKTLLPWLAGYCLQREIFVIPYKVPDGRLALLLVSAVRSCSSSCSSVSASRARSALVAPARPDCCLVSVHGRLGSVAGGDHLADALSGNDAQRPELRATAASDSTLFFCGRIAATTARACCSIAASHSMLPPLPTPGARPRRDRC